MEEVEVEEIVISNEPQFKLRIGGVLHGVFYSHEEALQYSESLKFNWPKDFSEPKR